MTYTILIDGSPVETAGSEAEARLKAEAVQANAGRYVDDEFGGAFALVGFAPSGDLSNISYILPREGMPDALVPAAFKQFR